VNGALALELYIKALAEAHDQRSARTHELAELYRQLPKAAKREIESAIPVAVAHRAYRGETDVPKILLRLNNAFVKWRYTFDFENVGLVEIEPAIFAMTVLHEACSVGLRDQKLAPAKT
jgi:hypothetical protein